jgi:cytidine deaminase
VTDQLSPEQQRLVEAAKVAAQATWSPYSSFPVGAALLSADGEVIHGCNVENISYGLTNCAERSALFAAISRGLVPGTFRAMAVYAPKVALISPCGACRQVLVELMAPDALIVCQGSDPAATRVWTLEQLLPGAFQDF